MILSFVWQMFLWYQAVASHPEYKAILLGNINSYVQVWALTRLKYCVLKLNTGFLILTINPHHSREWMDEGKISGKLNHFLKTRTSISYKESNNYHPSCSMFGNWASISLKRDRFKIWQVHCIVSLDERLYLLARSSQEYECIPAHWQSGNLTKCLGGRGGGRGIVFIWWWTSIPSKGNSKTPCCFMGSKIERKKK